jgi:hypothetical protein
MHGGIWTLCIDLTGRDMKALAKHGFKAKAKCVSYLAESVEVSRHEQLRYEYQHLDYQYTPHPNLSKYSIEYVQEKCFEFKNILFLFRLQECKIYQYPVH